MSRGTTTGPTLVKDLQVQLKALTADLRTRSDQADDPWAKDLKAEYERARERGRTGLTWSEWRDGEVDLAAVAWILATVFVRFCEDNGLIDGPWITGEGPRHAQAADNETAFYQADPTRNSRDWLRAGFAALADLPAGRDLLDPRHNLVWRGPISADAASALLAFWRAQNPDGTLVHDFSDEGLETRFLGDLYQDLSEYAKKKYALLQTPVFVEEFILDRTLTPAMEEFGLEGLKLIDPTCGSGHFLLGAFDRLLAAWQAQAPAMDTRTRVQKALDSIHGVDLNPFAVAIARFRLTVAALKASGLTRLKDAPAFDYHLAVGDSLIRHGVQTDLLADEDDFTYANEDVVEHPGILERGRYHVVVGNPPYITVKDKVLNERYRQDYQTCYRKYALTAPFMELFFQLAVRGSSDSPAGYIGKITSNSFMTREFGRPLIERLLSGADPTNPVDLTLVVDASGMYIPGHGGGGEGTPTVILFGRRRPSVIPAVTAVLGVRAEPGAPTNPARGLVWSEAVAHVDDHEFRGNYVSVAQLPREHLATHPWSLTGGSAGALVEALQGASMSSVGDRVVRIGFFGIMGADDAFTRPRHALASRLTSNKWRPLVVGEQVRDYAVSSVEPTFFPYDGHHELLELRPDSRDGRELWPLRTELGNRATFGKTTYFREGRPWYEWHQLPKDHGTDSSVLTFAFVATHNHFVLSEGHHVFKQSAPILRFEENIDDSEVFGLLAVLNSSPACFWLREMGYDKGGGGSEPWEKRFEFTGTKLLQFPLPVEVSTVRARRLDELARAALSLRPEAALSQDVVSRTSLAASRESWFAARSEMIFVQEELDWEVYRLYGLVDGDWTYTGGHIKQIELGQRAFEIALARKVLEGSDETAWFERHGSTPITEIPAHWPEDYRALVQRRLDLIASDPFIGLLERPEYKRRWQSPTFDDLLPDALRDYVLDKLEEPALWSDAAGPVVLSVAQLADRVRGDADLVEAVRLLRDAVEIDLTKELGELLSDEAVPYLAALRYNDSGMRKRAEWEAVWDRQRREDAGEKVSIPVPPKYGSGDFRKTSYWKARGKLDVPKERFISYPGAERPGDSSKVIGWAGWDQLDQARALARLIVERTQGEGLSGEQVLPLVAGMVELEPWLHQWHAEPDPSFGGMSPAAFLTGFIDSQLAALGATRTDAKAWRP